MKRFPLMRNNLQREDLEAVIAHLQQNDPILTSGPNVAAFEAEWSAWLGVKHSVFVNSGASANLLSMAILRLRYPEGGEVIVPPLTWVSDIASVLQNGFTPVFVDINPTTLGLDTRQTIAALTGRTRAVFITYTQGFDALDQELLDTLAERGIPLIEDVCESHGARHAGRLLGGIGWLSNFSFYYAHHMTTIEGGMISTNDPAVYQQARLFRSHGMVRESTDPELRARYRQDYPALNPEFIFAYPAFNVRNTEIGGILGRRQLKRLDENNIRRTRNLELFLSLIDPERYRTDFRVAGSSNYAFNLVLKQADHALMQRLMGRLDGAGVEYRRGSAGGGNQVRQPYLRGIVSAEAHNLLPQADHIHFYGMYIGNFPDLTEVEIREICEVINAD